MHVLHTYAKCMHEKKSVDNYSSVYGISWEIEDIYSVKEGFLKINRIFFGIWKNKKKKV